MKSYLLALMKSYLSKSKTAAKKSVSVFLAILMLLSCWVFFAPEAEAVDSQGTYSWRIKFRVTNKYNSNNNKYIVYTSADNGVNKTKSSVTISGTADIDSNNDSSDQYITGTSAGFPYKAYFNSNKKDNSDGCGTTTGEFKIALELLVNGQWTVICGDKTVKKDGTGDFNTTTDALADNSSYWPSVNSVQWVSKESDDTAALTISDNGNVSRTMQFNVFDQYGVRMSSKAVSPSATVNGSRVGSIGTNSTNNIYYSISNTNKDYFAITVTAKTAAKSTTYDDQIISVNPTCGGKNAGTRKFTLYDPSYTFSFNGNGGTLSPATASIRKYYYNYLTAAQVPKGTRTGYKFLGMYTTAVTSYDSSEPTLTGALTEKTPFEKDTQWYAAWWAKNVKVTFVNNDGTVLGTSEIGKYDKKVSETSVAVPSDPTFARREATGSLNYQFAGWRVETALDINGNNVPNSYNTEIDKYVLKGNTVFIATYKVVDENGYTVEFLKENGDVEKSTNYKYREQATWPDDPTKESSNYFDYKFIGWHKVANGEQRKGYVVNSNGYLSTDAESDAPDEGNQYISCASDFTVYDNATYVPVFKKVYRDYTFTFQYKDKFGNDKEVKQTGHYGDEITVWNDENGNPIYPDSYTQNGERYKMITFIHSGKITKEETLKVEYENVGKAKYNVNFNYKNQDGTDETKSLTVDHGDSITPPSTPSYRDENNEYTFAAWVDEEGNEYTTIPTGHVDVTYTAKYDASALYTATFYNEGTQFGDSAKYVKGDKIIAPKDTPEKASDLIASKYTFKGWATEENGEVLETLTMGEENVSFYAVYTPEYINYPITFVWKDENGNEKTLAKNYHYGDTITVPEKDKDVPATYEDDTYKYTFYAWDPDVSTVCVGALDEEGKPVPVTYTARYRRTYVNYTVTWMQETGTDDGTGKTIYGTYLTDAYTYNERVRLPEAPAAVASKPQDKNYTMVLDHWYYLDADGNEVPISRTFRVTTNGLKLYPKYKEEARVCEVKLYDENGVTLLSTVKVAYGADLTKLDSYSEPRKNFEDDVHYNFDKWLDLNGAEASTIITDDVSLKASYVSEAHDYTKVEKTVITLPTFDTEGSAEQNCTCGKTNLVTLPVIPDSEVPHAKLYVKDVITTHDTPADPETTIPVAPTSNLIIVTHDVAEESEYNKDGKGIGVNTIDYYVSFDGSVDPKNIADGDWHNRFDYDKFVDALVKENGGQPLSEEQLLLIKDYETNTSAYIGDLKEHYAEQLVNGAAFYFYAKITDKNGNTSYVSSNKLVYDATKPEIKLSGDGNGAAKFCVSATVTVTDNGTLESFTVDGEKKEIKDNTVTVTIEEVGDHQLVATDISGNVTTVNITILGAHKEKVYTTAATCNSEGKIVTRCTLCGQETKKAVPIEQLKHNFKEIKKVAKTCVDDGYTLSRCEYCGLEKKDITDKADGQHKFGDYIVTKAATCSATGLETATCSVCGERDTRVIPLDTKNGHVFYRGVVTKPTCTKDGYTTHKCKYCDFEETYDKVDKLGHVASDEWVIITPASCEGKDENNEGKGIVGKKVQYCVRDGAEDCKQTIMDTAEIPAPDHAWEFDKIVAPTETEKGYTLYKCQHCGLEKKGNIVDPLKKFTVTVDTANGADKVTYKKISGETITLDEPKKAADKVNRYTFSHWIDDDGNTVTLPLVVEKDITLTAVYSERAINYTITLLNEKNANNEYTRITKVGFLKYNSTISPVGPEKNADAYNEYEFAGWVKMGQAVVFEDYTDSEGKEVKATVSKTITVTEDAEYFAAYKATKKEYFVSFGYSRDDLIQTIKVEAGKTVSYSDLKLPTPVKASDDTYHYEFKEWVGDPLTNIAKDTLVLATFTETLHNRDGGQVGEAKAPTCTENGEIQYKCSCGYIETVVTPANGHNWGDKLNDDGNYVCTVCGAEKESGITYQVTFYIENDDGSLKQIKNIGYLKYKDNIADKIPTPTKADSATMSYTFSHWYLKGDAEKKAVKIAEIVTADAEYVAAFTASPRKFKVTYAVDADHVLKVYTVNGGDPLPAYDGADPVANPDNYNNYCHHVWTKESGWSKTAIDYPDGVTSDIYITAVFVETEHTCKVDSMKNATCTEPMTEHFKCTGCNYSYTKTQGKPNGHKYVLINTVEPSDSVAGYEEYKCSVCGDTYKKELAPKTYYFFTVIVKDQNGNPVQGARVSIFDGDKFIASGTTDANGKITFRVEEAKKYRVVIEGDDFSHTEGDITVNPDGSTDSDGFNVNVNHCSCTCHRDGIWPAIFRFFHKIIKMLVGHFVCCGNPDPRYGN